MILGGLALLVLGLLLPVIWILRQWGDLGLITLSAAILGLVVHVFIAIGLLYNVPVLAFIYLILSLLAICCSPLADHFRNRASLRQIAEEDLIRYRQLIERHPDNIAAYVQLGDTCLECRQYNEALKAFEHAITRDPSYQDLLYTKIISAQEALERQTRKTSKCNARQ